MINIIFKFSNGHLKMLPNFCSSTEDESFFTMDPATTLQTMAGNQRLEFRGFGDLRIQDKIENNGQKILMKSLRTKEG